MANTPKTKNKRTPKDDNKSHLSLVDTVEDDPTLTDSWESSPGEAMGAALEQWVIASRMVAVASQQYKTKLMMVKGNPSRDAKALKDEADAILKNEIPPLKGDLEVITWSLVDLLEENPALRGTIQNWEIMPKSLRGMLKEGLDRRGVDVKDMYDKADALEKERERKLAKG